MKTNTPHDTRGRALVFSTGAKLANSRLHILTLIGDGDGITIEGNHLIYAARRNVDVTAIMVNNLNYRMIGGQYSGTIPRSAIIKTSSYGHMEQSSDVCDAAKTTGGSSVARGTMVGTVQLERLIEQTMLHKRFSFAGVMSSCLTHYGRSNKLGKAPTVMEQVKGNTISDAKTDSMNRGELKGKFVTDIMENREQEDYSTAYQHVIDELKGGEM